MPARLTCPHCDAEFKPKTNGPPGKSVRCPDCERKFVPDDEDNRPRRSRRDDDDRPLRKATKRSGKKKAKRRNPLVIILPVGGAFLLVVVGIVLYLTVFRDRGPGGSADRKKVKIDNELLAALPEGPDDVRYVELGAILNHPRLPGNIRDDLLHQRERAFDGIPVEDVQVLAYAKGSSGNLLVLKPKNQPVDQDQIVAQTRGRPVNRDGKSAYKTDDWLVSFPSASLISLQPDSPWADRPSRRQGVSAFPSMYSEVKGHIWHGGGMGSGRMGGRSSGPQGVNEWSAEFRYSYTRITLLDDAVEMVSVTELASETDAAAYFGSEEGRRQMPGEANNEVARKGTTVTVRKIRPFEKANILGEAIPVDW